MISGCEYLEGNMLRDWKESFILRRGINLKEITTFPSCRPPAEYTHVSLGSKARVKDLFPFESATRPHNSSAKSCYYIAFFACFDPEDKDVDESQHVKEKCDEAVDIFWNCTEDRRASNAIVSDDEIFLFVFTGADIIGVQRALLLATENLLGENELIIDGKPVVAVWLPRHKLSCWLCDLKTRQQRRNKRSVDMDRAVSPKLRDCIAEEVAEEVGKSSFTGREVLGDPCIVSSDATDSSIKRVRTEDV